MASSIFLAALQNGPEMKRILWVVVANKRDLYAKHMPRPLGTPTHTTHTATATAADSLA